MTSPTTFVGRVVRGIRGTLPGGSIVGRLTPGEGPPELLSAEDLVGLAKTSPAFPQPAPPQEWQAGTVTAIGGTLTLTSGTLSAPAAPAQEWTAGTVSSLGSNLTLASGVLSASGGGGGGSGTGASGFYTRPALGSFTWYNRGTATATDNPQPGPLTMTAPGTSGINFVLLGQTVPATPWTVTAKIRRQQDAIDYLAGGIAAIDTVSGRVIMFYSQWNAGVFLTITEANSYTSYSSNVLAVQVSDIEDGWYRVTDDGTNLTFWFSVDGFDFIKVYTQARTAWLTNGAKAIAWGLNSQGTPATNNTVKLCGWDLSSGTGNLPSPVPVTQGGLWSQVMSPTPTQSSTGLTTWLNQTSGSTVANAATGVAVTAPSNGSADKFSVINAAAPSTPYSFTALLTVAVPISGNGSLVFGWSDGTKATALRLYSPLPYPNSSAVGHMPTIAGGSVTNVASNIYPATQQWIKLVDDGTNLYFYMSNDGASWLLLYSEARLSYLASVSDIIFGVDYYNGTGSVTASILSWTRGTS